MLLIEEVTRTRYLAGVYLLWGLHTSEVSLQWGTYHGDPLQRDLLTLPVFHSALRVRQSKPNWKLDISEYFRDLRNSLLQCF